MSISDNSSEQSMEEILASIRKIIAEEPPGSRPTPDQRAVNPLLRPSTGGRIDHDLEGLQASSSSSSGRAAAGVAASAHAKPSIDIDLSDLLEDAPAVMPAASAKLAVPVSDAFANWRSLPAAESKPASADAAAPTPPAAAAAVGVFDAPAAAAAATLPMAPKSSPATAPKPPTESASASTTGVFAKKPSFYPPQPLVVAAATAQPAALAPAPVVIPAAAAPAPTRVASGNVLVSPAPPAPAPAKAAERLNELVYRRYSCRVLLCRCYGQSRRHSTRTFRPIRAGRAVPDRESHSHVGIAHRRAAGIDTAALVAGYAEIG